MKILGIIRHAKSDWSDRGRRDFDRGLNARGRRGAALMGAHIRDYGVRWDSLLASPAERVRRTLESADLGVPPAWDERLYLADSHTIIDLLHNAEGDAVLIAGHNPGLADLILDLIAPQNENALFDEAKVKFPTAAFAVFELGIEDWNQIKPECGKLVHFARPRDLDAELGPID